jgi:hypothetical protein
MRARFIFQPSLDCRSLTRLRVGAETGFTNSTEPLPIQSAARGLEENPCEFENLALQGRALEEPV